METEEMLQEKFYGVYLLCCTNPQYKGRTYVGFTVNPERRKKQHNKGRQFGGAWRTHGKGPWEMVLIIHGFPNMISALRFEWAWTKPWQSRRLKHLPRKKNSERKYEYQLRVLWQMLRTPPWQRLPLTIQWIKQSYKKDFCIDNQPPVHMRVEYGPVKCAKARSGRKQEDGGGGGGDDVVAQCGICKIKIEHQNNKLRCLSCHSAFHTTCLATSFLPPAPSLHLLPVEGSCPCCQAVLLWGDLIRFKRACHHRTENDPAISIETHLSLSNSLQDDLSE